MRILVISDIHGNYEALKTVLDRVEYDYLWVLGDLVDYGPDPHLVVDTVKSLKPDIILMGNHDYAVAYRDDCRCDPSIHWLSVYTRENISYRLLSEEQIKWLSSLERKSVRDIGGYRVMAVHGSPRNPLYGYLYPGLSDDEKLLQLTESPFALRPRPVDVDVVVHGHTHIPNTEVVKGIKLFNPGSLGQPRDGDPRASIGVIDLDKNVFEIHRIEYDVESVVKRYRDLGIEDRYLDALMYILRKASIEGIDSSGTPI
ncbi:phosphodiesterase, MJ0936 family [Ignisphaera aggregans DSM 17230]|uniref:Phosphodiesterase, MJ0936 family n=1 Tax=Ignisphaera aggregans (strain DSM 17230 / JCM 13409 / AQ1.S1) TaxID=583356 RepID=E0SQ05_IGNAA|nr:phosphodiesterase, MJ0936 family [Ignisphaera aggregans DSM 17230]